MLATDAASIPPLCAYLWLYGNVQRGSRWLGADGGWAKRARKVEERVSLRHGGQTGFRGGDDVGEATRAVDSVMWWGKLILFAKSGQVRFANLR